ELEIRFDYEDVNSNYRDFEYIEARVNPSYLDVDVNEILTTITSNGGLGFNDFLLQTQGKGFRSRNATNVLFEGGFLVASGPARVSDHVRNGSFRDDDFQMLSPVRRDFQSARADFESRTIYNDDKASNPIQVTVEEETFAWSDFPHQQYIIQQYIIKNDQPQAIESLYAGIFMDWEINPVLNISTQELTTFNAGAYDEVNKLAFAYDRFANGKDYYGVALLSGQDFHTFVAEAEGGISYSSMGKYEALRNVPSPTTSQIGVTGSGVDLVQFVSGGPFKLEAGATDTLVFAIFGVRDINQIASTRDQALSRYTCAILRKGVSQAFTLSDTTPNTLTVIDFQDQNPQADSWTWDFGDGTDTIVVGHGQTITHQFPST
ncbi:MAG: hypothetical protein AAFR59_18205, partial [Bacteroidota bacterium]